MPIDGSLIADAGFLSAAAYGKDTNGNPITAALALSSESPAGITWSPLDAFGLQPYNSALNSSYFVNGYFTASNAQAMVALDAANNTLALVFRGTDQPADLLTDAGGTATFSGHYNQYIELTRAVLAYAAEPGNNIEKILITGHSLGGAMVEMFMYYNTAANIVGVSLASPGENTLFGGFGDPRLINIFHSQDPVANAAPFGINHGTDIEVDLPYSSPGVIILGEHAGNLYVDTSAWLGLSELWSVYQATPDYWSVRIGDRSDNVDLAGSPTNDFILGGDGADNIHGMAGDDLIDGGSGGDLIDGGEGNDALAGGAAGDEIYAGTGQDTVLGGDGDDNLHVAGLGPDWIDGGDGNDFLDLNRSDLTQTQIFTIATGTFSLSDSTRIAGVERGTLMTGSGDDTIRIDPTGQEFWQLSAGGGYDRLIVDFGFFTTDVTATNGMVNSAGSDNLGHTVRYDGTFEAVDVKSGAGDDYISFGSGAGYVFTSYYLSGAEGNDTLISTFGSDVLDGGLGNDNLDAGYGSDFVSGGAGDDFLTVWGGGADTIDGGSGIDTGYLDRPDLSAGQTIVHDTTILSSFSFTDGTTIQGIELFALLATGDGSDTLTVVPTVPGTQRFDLNGGRDRAIVDFSAFTQAIVTAGGGAFPTSAVSFTSANFDVSLVFEVGVEDYTYLGGSGDDVIWLPPGANIILGGGGNDQLFSTLDHGRIEGGQGNDTIESTGSGTLTGGSGNDRIRSDNGYVDIDAGADNDVIYVSGPGPDTLNGGDGNDRAIIQRADLIIAQTLVVRLDQGTTFTLFDGTTLTSIESLDLITGTGDDIVTFQFSAPGNHSFDGASGRDRGIADFSNFSSAVTTTNAPYVQVETQNGLYSVQFSSTVEDLTILSGSGDDQLLSLNGNDILNGALGDDSLSSGNGNDFLLGGEGNDTLLAGDGNDTLVGDAGNDRLDGGNAYDIADYSSISAAIVVNLNLASNQAIGSEIGIDQLIAIESIVAGAGNDVITGDNLGNSLLGGNGNDILDGMGGNDLLDGGDGDDTLKGGAGADTITGGNGVDTADFSDTAFLGITITLNENGDSTVSGPGISTDRIFSIENLISGFGNDRLTGNASANFLNGGAGTDTLVGGLGDDTYYADTYLDVITETAGQGTDTIISTSSFLMSLAPNVENLTLVMGAGLIDGLGNAENNIIIGNDSRNGITGGGGNDTIIGNGGDDAIDGGIGADSMIGGSGVDTYYVDNAGDAVVETEVGATLYDTVWTNLANYTLPDNVEIYISINNSGSINGTGNDLTTLMLGNEGDNILNSLGGNDIILGRDGNDTINSGAGGDPSGYEVISGGVGADSLTGGGGHDFFNYELITHGGDIITDFQTNAGIEDDILDFRPMFPTFTNTAGITTSAQAVASGHLTYVQSGANVQVFADANGAAHAPGEQVLMATLLNQTAASVQTYTLI